MIKNSLFLVHGALLLFFGVFLSASFSDIKMIVGRNIRLLLILCIFCGVLQITTLFLFEEAMIWKMYPLITHLPLLLFLCIVFHKRITTVLASIFTAYLFCQPAKWLGIMTYSFTENVIAEYCIRILALGLLAFLILRYLSDYFSKIYNKDTRSVCIFGMMPFIYYVFDYITMIYTDLWLSNNRIVIEFLPVFLGITFMVFCVLYCGEYEEKMIAEYKANMIQITSEQQKKEIESIKRNEQSLRILRHDLRMFLGSLNVCLSEGKTEQAMEMISTYTKRIQSVKMKQFCSQDIINYVLSDYSDRFEQNEISFSCTVALEHFDMDPNLFAPILSNALDNALNAQEKLEPSKRSVRLLLKTANKKLLLSVENPISDPPLFVDGMPISRKKGHGYGIQSILYMTERLGGKCQFSVKDGQFSVKIII